MSLSSLLPLAGAAFAPVLGKVVEGVTDGLSFLDVLHEQGPTGAADAVPRAEPNTLQQDFAKLADRLREKFAQLGIDLTTRLRLKQDGGDRVVVDGDHPDRVLIESMFRDDNELTRLFNEAAQAAARGRNENDAGISEEFRFVLTPTDAQVEFA